MSWKVLQKEHTIKKSSRPFLENPKGQQIADFMKGLGRWLKFKCVQYLTDGLNFGHAEYRLHPKLDLKIYVKYVD